MNLMPASASSVSNLHEQGPKLLHGTQSSSENRMAGAESGRATSFKSKCQGEKGLAKDGSLKLGRPQALASQTRPFQLTTHSEGCLTNCVLHLHLAHLAFQSGTVRGQAVLTVR